MVTDEKNIRQKYLNLQCQTKKQKKMKISDKIKSGAGIVTGTATVLGGQAAAMRVRRDFQCAGLPAP